MGCRPRRNVTLTSPWKFISRIYLAFHKSLRDVVEGGVIRFWEDRW